MLTGSSGSGAASGARPLAGLTRILQRGAPMTIRSLAFAVIASSSLVLPAAAQMTAPATPMPAAPMPTTPAPINAPAITTDLFYSEVWTPSHWRASEAMGLAVYNRSGERIGEIDDMLIDGSGRVMAAVVGVGGFLGMGERKVAVTFRSFAMTRQANGDPRLVVDVTKAKLQAAPEYKPAVIAKRS
jgi:hypothetical protein